MNGLLKFITCGSVDDGKSTLIGHILYDSKLLYADQERALELDSKAGSRGGRLDYSLLLDGLMEEREQGITIDVAYRYFTTDRRSFIVADTPGHEEYTRNMAVGASFADLAVILIDASQGVLIQTKRHARICTLMGIRYFVFAVNKMDLIDYSEETFKSIAAVVNTLAAELSLEHVVLIPVSATEGDNVTKRSTHTIWYDGPVLLEYLEQVNIEENQHTSDFYMPVQRVCRPDRTFRGFQGQAEDGEIHQGDTIRILPSGEMAHVKRLLIGDRDAPSASKGQPVTIQLDREVDVSRGCVLTSSEHLKVTSSFSATLLWMDEEILENGRNFFVKLGTRLIPGTVTKIETVIDVNTGAKQQADTLKKNEIAICRITLSDRIVADRFEDHAALGELILIDRVTYRTAACGIVTEISEDIDTVAGNGRSVAEYLRQSLKGQKPVTAAFVEGRGGISAGMIRQAEKQLAQAGRHTYFYAPGHDEDFRTVAGHLKQAGLVTLLMLSEEQAHGINPEHEGWMTGWKDCQDAQSISERIRKESSFVSLDAYDRDYI